MNSRVSREEVGAAIESIDHQLTSLFDIGVEPTDARDSVECIAEFEQLRRRLDALQAELFDSIDERCLHVADGHASTKVMMRHVGGLSRSEAAARHKTSRMLRALPQVAAAYRAGQIGTDHVRTLARVHANPRVRDAMEQRQVAFLKHACEAHHRFEKRVRRWERLVDDDGPTPPADPAHDNRNATILQNFNGSWNFAGSSGSIQGATMREIHDQYVKAETEADWREARAEYGDGASAEHLARSASQRRADALFRIFTDAASNRDSAVPPGYTHNVVWSEETFNEYLRRAAGGTPRPIDPDNFVCHTLDGHDLDPNEAIASAFVSRVRRVVADARGTVIDLGEARFFTGSSRHAVKLQSSECVWPGCDVPSSMCEADHLREHARTGRTHPGNGAPLCGKHNRWKQKGFTIWRASDGTWHTVRPDGTEV